MGSRQREPMGKKSSFSSEYKQFCRLLREARINAGLTQADVAKQVNRPQSYVSKYESGERRLDAIEFIRVARALNLDPAAILKSIT